MKKRLLMQGALCSMLMSIAAGEAQAAQTLRVQVDQKGDFLLIGNTLGYECLAGTPAPIVGTLGACGSNTGDTAPDIFWRSEEPAAGQAAANNMITVAQARSTSLLTIPPMATVTHAFLYWGANIAGGDPTATLDRPGGFTQDLTAMTTYTSANNSYQSVADITAIVQAQGSGTYRVSGVDGANLVNLNSSSNFMGWWMVVFYQLGTEPPRNLALFDGLDQVSNGNPQNLTLTGFLVPPVFANAKLGVVSFEGDNTLTGDSFSFGPAPALSDGVNAANNFFNGSRSFLGVPVSNVGDLPQLTGGPQSLSGIDIDVVDVTSKLMGGQTSVPIAATSTNETYYLGGFVTSIPTFKPDFSTSQKSAVDINGGSLLPGDLVEYTVVVTNTGNDTSINTVLTDPLPVGVTYAPGTTSISAGPNMGTKTDAAADDQCEYTMATKTVLCRLGTGANGAMGGQMLVGDSSTVKFRVTIDATASGTIFNQATITAGGLLGAPAEGTPTDGNGVTNGEPPTPIVVDKCETDVQCMMPTPYCNVAPTPNACVACLLDMQCGAATPTCDLVTNTCTCVPSGAEVCDGKDNDCDGIVDNNCTDTDGDGIPDIVEQQAGTDPNDADSDDDGVLDGAEINWSEDSDGDGLINALDSDSDNDGLFDGTEMGLNCANPATDPNAKQCIPDADMGTTKTNPLDPDTDNGGIPDGSEDFNKNGQIDSGEGNPNNPADDSTLVDTDGDGLTDGFETQIGSNPMDADTDDDGVPDGQEPNPAADSDGDGLINVLDSDSDNDGLFDGTEMGFDCSNPATNPAQNSCIADADMGATKTSPIDPDTDDGGVTDGSEDFNKNGQIDPGEGNPNNPVDDSMFVDSDGDGLTDAFETQIGSNPNDADSDDDGVIDGQEANPAEDSDGDGNINVLDADSDNDGLFDGTELGLDCSNPATDPSKNSCIPDADKGATKTSPLDPDTDNGGIPDGSEDINRNGQIDPGEGNPNNPADDSSQMDSDGDGLSDGFETQIGSDPMDADSDDDGVPDGQEPNPAADSDGDGLINVLDADSDNDGLFDGTEMGFDCSNPATDNTKKRCVPDADMGGTTTSPIDPDTDNGGISDGSEDANKNGRIDAGEGNPNNPADDSTITDTDGDGLSDAFETQIGSNPNDVDSDDDGVPDGQEANPAEDTDGDGLVNVLDPDSDNDGLFDGTELGLDCSNPATNPAANNCIADADKGVTTTSPLDPDTDNGGIPDGVEDTNHNGTIDSGEGNPNDPADDVGVTDSDGDGLTDVIENQIGSDPNDADSDDDGVVDGQEVSPSVDSDGDGLINVLDSDSDNDGLADGTEMGFGCSNPDTDASKNRCIPDGDLGTTKTDPLDPDTDNGGISDGSEDFNKNGTVEPGEGDPNNPADDSTIVDTDGDGLSDAFETQIGSDPNDADSDDDGVPDGKEANPAEDTDGDGKINVLDADSDNDGLFDGTELGLDCSSPATNPATNTCIPDADKGATTTSPLNPDTDGGGVPDGIEDGNHNGTIDLGEGNPNDPIDDIACMTDAECGNATSGRICDATAKVCVPGCRGMNGNGCPAESTCSSKNEAAGTCSAAIDDGIVFTGGCVCTTSSNSTNDSPVGFGLAIAAACAAVIRRRKS